MASLKEVKNRISSVKSTRQITSAMKMVASAKLHKAQGRIENMLPYQRKLNEILTNFLSTDVSFESLYTEVRPVARVAIVVFSSNTSLCGAFNSNVVKMLEHRLEEYQALGKENILIYPVGKKVEEAVKKLGYVPQGTYQPMCDRPSYADASQLAATLMEQFIQKEVDQVELVYHHFKSTGSQVLMYESYLPIDLEKIRQEAGGDKVKEMQQKLKNWGYLTGSADGIFGSATESAVKYFQRRNGLTADGVVGSATAAALGMTLSSGPSSGGGGGITSSDLNLLARVVYGEARGEEYIGQVAVAAVVLNRVESSSFPNTIAGVVYQAGAFDCVADGQINLTPDDTAVKAAQDALNGWDPTYGCLFYYNPRTATSAWMLSRPVKLVIGQHNFC